jgi:diaminopimelate epimerase
VRHVQFTKMQGLGNDFIVVDGPASFDPEEVAALCDRRFGVGADGILVVSRLDPVRMEYWNADGSAAEMCGNGLRCVARYVYDRGWVRDRDFMVQTPVGVRGARVLGDDIEVELGPVSVNGITTIEGMDFHLVDVGNPHAVTFVSDPAVTDVDRIGRLVQERFEMGTNVEFVSVDGNHLDMRVWERGVGETLACGTGMAAAVAAADEHLAIGTAAEVTVPGGSAAVEIRDGRAWIRGPAAYSFRGSVGEQ